MQKKSSCADALPGCDLYRADAPSARAIAADNAGAGRRNASHDILGGKMAGGDKSPPAITLPRPLTNPPPGPPPKPPLSCLFLSREKPSRVAEHEAPRPFGPDAPRPAHPIHFALSDDPFSLSDTQPSAIRYNQVGSAMNFLWRHGSTTQSASRHSSKNLPLPRPLHLPPSFGKRGRVGSGDLFRAKILYARRKISSRWAISASTSARELTVWRTSSSRTVR